VIVVGRSRERLEQTKALAPGVAEIVALDELGDGWQESDAVAEAIRAHAPDGVDAVIDYTPEGPLPWRAARAMRVGGKLVIRAARRGTADVPMIDLMHSCWQIVGTRNGTRLDTTAVTRLLAAGHLEVGDLFTHRFRLAQVNEGLATMRGRSAKTWFVGVDVP
jgi:threonine dehydrogenase-like Zn-dependent dehydrogenase